MPSSSPDHATVKAWMRRQVLDGDFREALDDETHPVWDWAIEAFDTSTSTRSR